MINSRCRDRRRSGRRGKRRRTPNEARKRCRAGRGADASHGAALGAGGIVLWDEPERLDHVHGLSAPSPPPHPGSRCRRATAGRARIAWWDRKLLPVALTWDVAGSNRPTAPAGPGRGLTCGDVDLLAAGRRRRRPASGGGRRSAILAAPVAGSILVTTFVALELSAAVGPLNTETGRRLWPVAAYLSCTGSRAATRKRRPSLVASTGGEVQGGRRCSLRERCRPGPADTPLETERRLF